MSVIYGEADEDGIATVFTRLAGLDGSGSEYKPGEGKAFQQADVSSIACKVFEIASRDAEAGTEITPAPTVTVAGSIFDTLRTVGWDTSKDAHGYNFRHDLQPAFLADPGEWRCIEYKFTLATGGIAWLEARIKTRGKLSS